MRMFYFLNISGSVPFCPLHCSGPQHFSLTAIIILYLVSYFIALPPSGLGLTHTPHCILRDLHRIFLKHGPHLFSLHLLSCVQSPPSSPHWLMSGPGSAGPGRVKESVLRCFHHWDGYATTKQSNKQHSLLNQTMFRDVADLQFRPSFLHWCEPIRKCFVDELVYVCVNRVIDPNTSVQSITSVWSLRIPKIQPLAKPPAP